MLPGSVEEIDKFLRAQGIKNPELGVGPRAQVCPIAQWVRRWVGLEDVGAGYDYVRIADNGTVNIPDVVEQYIFYADRHDNRD